MVLRIDPQFGEDWRAGRPAGVELDLRQLAAAAVRHDRRAAARRCSAGYGQQVGTLRLIARGVHPAVAQPLRVGRPRRRDARSRASTSRSRCCRTCCCCSAFIGGMQLAIDATAGERERQSLEPLLATPASREAIISGKILATAAFTLLSVLITLVMYRVAFALRAVASAPTLSLAVPLGRAWRSCCS